jgi:hypothetical protein
LGVGLPATLYQGALTGFYAIYRPAKPPSPGIPIKPVLTGLSIISQQNRVCVFTTTLFIPFGLRYFGGAGHTEFFVFTSTLAIQPLANGWSPVAEREMKKPFATEFLVVTLPNHSNGIR